MKKVSISEVEVVIFVVVLDTQKQTVLKTLQINYTNTTMKKEITNMFKEKRTLI
jgi:hypothetical protein